MAKLNYGVSPTSVVLRVKLLNSSVTTGAGLTGLTYSSSGLLISTIQIAEATPTVYTAAGSTIETITTLGTYAAPTATKCRFKEVDATNHPGLYEIQFANARFASENNQCSLIVSVSGATNLAQCDIEVELSAYSVLSVAGAVGSVTGAVGSVTGNVGGTVASVTGAVGSVTAGVTLADSAITAAKIADAAIDIATFAADCKTGTYLNAQVKGQDNIDFGALQKTSLNAATPTSVQNISAQTGDSYARLGAPAGASVSADILVIDNFVDDLETRLTATRAGYLDNLSAGAVALEATLTAIKGAGWTTETMKAIKEYVDDIGAAGAGLTALPWNASWDAEVQSETTDALNAYDPPTRAELTTDKDSIITEVNANETKIDAVKVDTAAIKIQTDALPSGIAKNVALSNFQFLMVLSSDHVTAATGKTVTGTISKDGGAFVAVTNAISEIGNGMYKVNLTQTEMNADVVTLKFTETNCDQRIITVYTT
jgi:hypothetical protein